MTDQPLYAEAREDAIGRLMTALRPLPTPEERYAQAEWVFDGIVAAIDARIEAGS